MRLNITIKKRKKLAFSQMPIELIPFIRIFYKPDLFLESGVFTKALLIEFGWLKFCKIIVIQESY
jgi:hypothetical protein